MIIRLVTIWNLNMIIKLNWLIEFWILLLRWFDTSDFEVTNSHFKGKENSLITCTNFEYLFDYTVYCGIDPSCSQRKIIVRHPLQPANNEEFRSFDPKHQVSSSPIWIMICFPLSNWYRRKVRWYRTNRPFLLMLLRKHWGYHFCRRRPIASGKDSRAVDAHRSRRACQGWCHKTETHYS